MRKQKPREIQWLTDGRTYSEIQYFLPNLVGYIPENPHAICLRDLWPWEENRVWGVNEWTEGSYHNCFLFPNIKYYRCHWHTLFDKQICNDESLKTYFYLSFRIPYYQLYCFSFCTVFKNFLSFVFLSANTSYNG